MKPPQPGTHWTLNGTVHVVARYERLWDTVHTVTEDGHSRSFPLPYWTDRARPASRAQLGLDTPQRPETIR